MSTIKFAYLGRNEWRGFLGSCLAAKIIKAGDEYNAQVKMGPRRVLSKPGFKTWESARTWIIRREAAK